MNESNSEDLTTWEETETDADRDVQSVRERLQRVVDSLDTHIPDLVETAKWFATAAEQELAARGYATFADVRLGPELPCHVFGEVTSDLGTDLRALNKRDCACTLEKYATRAPIAARAIRRELGITALGSVCSPNSDSP